MKPRLHLAALGLTLLGIAVVLQAGEQPRQGAPNLAQLRDELTVKQQQLTQQFEEFQLNMFKLKQRFERGNEDEKRQALRISKILDEVRKENIRTELDQLADSLNKNKLTNLNEVKDLGDRSTRIAAKLQRLIQMFQEDPRQQQLREEKEILKKFIDDLSKLIKGEQQLQGQTENGKTSNKELQQTQDKIGNDNKKLQQAIDNFLGKKGDSVAKDAADLKGGPKDGGKGDESGKANAKDAGDEKQIAQGKAKDAGDKDGKDGDGSKAVAKGDEKAGDKSGKEGGDAQAKEGKNSDGKPGAEGSQAKDNKDAEGAQASQAKGNEGKKGDEAGSKGNEGSKDPQANAKPSEKPAAQSPQAPSQAKQGGEASKPGAKESKGAEGAPSQAKQGGQKPSESKGGQGQAKAGSESKGQGDAKGDGSKSSPSSPSSSQASAKSSPSDPSPSSPSDPSDQANQGNQGNPKTKDKLEDNKKKLKEAGYDMASAAKKLGDGKKKPAIDDEQKVIDTLEAAKKELEKLLRQTREEELERLLAALEARCKKMLEMQIAVRDSTVATHKAMLSHPGDDNALRADRQASLKLSDHEKDIITEANKAIQMLEEEGSAVAFPEVFQQVREDMKHVQRRLEIADVADVTQAVENDIIASLKEMIEALQKAQKDLDKSKSGKPGESGPPPDQKLLEKIAELKMIRSLQKRINDRTEFYGRLFPNEQALDPNLRQQLQQLGERQERIFEIMDRFAKGDGK